MAKKKVGTERGKNPSGEDGEKKWGELGRDEAVAPSNVTKRSRRHAAASTAQCEEVGRRRCFVAGFLGKVGEGPACFKVLAQFPGKSKAG